MWFFNFYKFVSYNFKLFLKGSEMSDEKMNCLLCKKEFVQVKSKTKKFCSTKHKNKFNGRKKIKLFNMHNQEKQEKIFNDKNILELGF